MELAAVCMRPRMVAEIVVHYAEAGPADLVQCVESILTSAGPAPTRRGRS